MIDTILQPGKLFLKVMLCYILMQHFSLHLKFYRISTETPHVPQPVKRNILSVISKLCVNFNNYVCVNNLINLEGFFFMLGQLDLHKTPY